MRSIDWWRAGMRRNNSPRRRSTASGPERRWIFSPTHPPIPLDELQRRCDILARRIAQAMEAQAEVKRLQKQLGDSLRTVAERQREACAKEAEGVEARGHGMDADEAGTRDACVDAVRAAPLVTKENS